MNFTEEARKLVDTLKEKKHYHLPINNEDISIIAAALQSVYERGEQAVASGNRDIYEVSNQLMGYVGPDTNQDLAEFLKREADAACVLADRIVALESAPAPIPAGWKLVPVDPTNAMLAQFAGIPVSFLSATKMANERRHYAAMLAAAPSPKENK